MNRNSPALGRLLHACGAVVLLCGGCGGTEPEELLAGTYSMPFEPPMVIDAGGACQRAIGYAILDVGDGAFDVRVILPKGYGQLAAHEVELRLGPRQFLYAE